jgi:hypothetical protein
MVPKSATSALVKEILLNEPTDSVCTLWCVNDWPTQNFKLPSVSRSSGSERLRTERVTQSNHVRNDQAPAGRVALKF